MQWATFITSGAVFFQGSFHGYLDIQAIMYFPSWVYMFLHHCLQEAMAALQGFGNGHPQC